MVHVIPKKGILGRLYTMHQPIIHYTKKRTNDPECVSGHVVRLGIETGFLLGEHTSPMTYIGCESRHTASGPQDGKYEPASNSCIGRHNSEHSICVSF